MKTIFLLSLLQDSDSTASPTRHTSGGGVGSPRGLSKSTVVTLTVVTVISVVYAACSPDPSASVLVIIPPLMKLSKYCLKNKIIKLKKST